MKNQRITFVVYSFTTQMDEWINESNNNNRFIIDLLKNTFPFSHIIIKPIKFDCIIFQWQEINFFLCIDELNLHT